MGPKEISARIQKELGGDLTTSNWHNCDLTKCLIKPKSREMWTMLDERRTFWVVLEECPETHEGWKIVFDEDQDCFGLAQDLGDDRHLVVGFHRTFLAAFKAM